MSVVKGSLQTDEDLAATVKRLQERVDQLEKKEEERADNSRQSKYREVSLQKQNTNSQIWNAILDF